MNESVRVNVGPRKGVPGSIKATFISVAFALMIVVVPAALHAASVGIGATIWCAWWSPSNAAAAALFGSSAKGDPVPAAAGGPFLSAQINDTWGLNISYLYGAFSRENPSLLFGSKSVDERHDLDIAASAAVHGYVKLYLGARYRGQMSDMTRNVLFLSWESDMARHHGGPLAGVNLAFPLGAGFYLMPDLSMVFLFGKLSRSMGGFLGSMLGSLVSAAGRDSAAMFYGLNSALAFAYKIEKANLTLALGGRFQYLWLYFIESEKQADDGDMFAGITFSAMYTFNIPGKAGGGK